MRVLSMLVALLLAATIVNSQDSKLSLNLTAGYNFSDQINYDVSKLKIGDGGQYGASLEYFTSRRNSIELSYSWMGPDATFTRPSGKDTTGSLGLHYILIGSNAYFPQSFDSKVIPFIGGGLGLGIVDGSKDTETKFAFNLKAGVKIKTKSAVSIKLNAYLQSMISTAGTDYFYYWGYYYAVPDYASLWQFGLGGAISLDFKHRAAASSNQ